MARGKREEALQFAAENRQQHLAELIEFLKIPSVSTQAKRAADMARAAEWLADGLGAAGLEQARVIETRRHPLVYAEWLHAGSRAPTLLVYGHYDVQPAEPLDAWRSPPFEPIVRDDYLYARGVADDKGQLYIHVKAVEAYLRAGNSLPVNVKFILEGEEEVGGSSLTQFVENETRLLEADVAVLSDTAMIGPGQPAIIYGLRGMCYMLVDIRGPSRDIHSGSYGGAVNNPLNVLSRAIARLQDETGQVLIPGFYDDVRPLTDAEREVLAAVPLDEEEWLERTGAPAAWGEPGYTLMERTVARPTLDVNGLIGGYTGDGSKTIIPSMAHAKVSMRLVPDQDPREIERLFRSYVQEVVPSSVRVKMTNLGAVHPSIIDYDTDAVHSAMEAYTTVFGRAPALRRAGGSIPVVGDFKKHLGIETVMMGFGLPGDRIHSPNERFYLPNFYQGIETVIHFLAEYGQRFRRQEGGG